MVDDLENKSTSKQNFFTQGWELVKKFWSVRFFRFLFVGGINTLFGYLVYSAFILLGLHFSIASFLSTVMGIVFNFFTTGNIVFRNKNPKLIIRFFGVYGVTYLINLGLLKIFDLMHMNMVLAGGIILLPMAVVSYFLNRTFVFTKKTSELKSENND